MRRSVKNLIGYSIKAKDGNIGHVKDFYFDDKAWILRYLVVDTGNWLPGRKVLLSPDSLEKPDWEKMIFPVNLTKSTIRNSPGIDTHKTVSREHEIELFQYYGWRPYWEFGVQPGVVPLPIHSPDEKDSKEEHETNLRSSDEVIGYHIETTDGKIGHVEDFIIDDTDWSIRYLIVDTRNVLPGKKVIISKEWIETVTWNEKKIKIGLLREAVKNSPEFNPSIDVEKNFENDVFDQYGKLKHW